MPDSWWECAAALWRCVLQTGRIPRAWTRGRTSLLWKASGKSRPITVLPILWRAGAKLINEQLSGWCMSWRTARDTGGLPGTSVAAALQQLHFETQQGFRAVAQQDIASFFDSLEYGATEAILTHLKAPPELVRLFTSACAQSQRIFALEGALSKDWYRPTRGLPQGCPLSPLIAAAVTHVWACHVLGVEDQVDRPITGYGYVDDRVLLLRRHGSFQDLALAVERSNQFDRAMQLEVSLPKCAIIAEASCQEAAALARTLGYKHLQDLETSGVVVPQHGPWRLLKFSLRKLQVRLQLLRSLGLPNRTIGLLLRSLIVPCFTWAAAYAAPDAAELTAIRQEINHMTARFSTFGCARVLLHETIGWFLDPQFCLDVATLRAYWRSVVQPMDWTEALPLSELQGYVIKALPMLEPTLQRLQWALSADTKEGGVGLLSLEPGGVGLRLPPPSRDAQFAFGGHRECFRAAGSDRELLLASIGAGASNWHYNAGATLRHGGAAAPPAIDLQDFKEHLVELLGTFADEQDLFVATDGSSKDGVGSSGIAVQHPDSVAAFGDGLEDQSPYRMEVLALALALGAIDIARRAPKVRWRRVYLVVDCQAAIRAIQGEQGFDYALLLDTIRRYIKKFRDGKLEVEFVWTPSQSGTGIDGTTLALKAIATIAKAYRDYLHTLGTPSGEP
ncbi:L96 [Symbiodinium sp. CCMP2592]|nr:L96 [Symbiodinium sp. CCMP2592]